MELADLREEEGISLRQDLSVDPQIGQRLGGGVHLGPYSIPHKYQ